MKIPILHFSSTNRNALEFFCAILHLIYRIHIHQDNIKKLVWCKNIYHSWKYISNNYFTHRQYVSLLCCPCLSPLVVSLYINDTHYSYYICSKYLLAHFNYLQQFQHVSKSVSLLNYIINNFSPKTKCSWTYLSVHVNEL